VKWFDRPEASATWCRRRGVFVAHGETDGPLSDGFRAVEPGARVQFRIREEDAGLRLSTSRPASPARIRVSL
jgi:hypothetical protein